MVVGPDASRTQRKWKPVRASPIRSRFVAGAAVGEQVVIGGGVGLEDGTKVRIVAPAEEGRRAMSELPAGAALDRAARQADHFRHPDAGRRRRLSGARPSPSPCFPKPTFPRILVGVDNGVAPIDQMLVTVTRPIEEAVNTVQGLERVHRSPAAAPAEIDLFFSWKVDMFQTLAAGQRRAGASRSPRCRRPPESPPIA